MYEVAICDDELRDRQFLKADISRSEKYEGMLRFHEYNSGMELLEDMKQIDFSIIFMDIQMEGMDGEETAREIRKLNDNVVLVFCTAYAEPGVHSFEVQPYRYIKKNMPDKERQKYIEASLEKMESVWKVPCIQGKYRNGKLLLRPDDIIYMEKCKKYIQVYISEPAKMRYQIADNPPGEIRIYDKLGNIYEKLKPYGYGCPHSSYVINFRFLMACGKNKIWLEGGHVMTVTRSRAVEFNQLKMKFFSEKYEDGGKE